MSRFRGGHDIVGARDCAAALVWHALSVIYFDANATSPLCAVAREAWLDAVDRYPGNPSSLHRVGARADAALERAREQLASRLECDPGLIVWTSGATESANLAFHHLARAATPGSEAWVAAIEHPCVLASAALHFPERIHQLAVLKTGSLDLARFEKSLHEKPPALVAVMAANNETGVLQPWGEVRSLCRDAKVPFLCDATQWIGRRSAAALGACDYLFGSAHKMGGPKGAGFLKIASTRGFQPMYVGGPQESGRRAGTENLPGILSMIATLEDREQRIAGQEWRPSLAAKTAFEESLLASFPGAEIVGRSADRLWNTSMAVMPALDGCRQRWVVKLDKLGFAASTGSACASGKEQTSHVLSSMGYEPQRAANALRFSVSWESPPEEWERLLRTLKEIQDGRA